MSYKIISKNKSEFSEPEQFRKNLNFIDMTHGVRKPYSGIPIDSENGCVWLSRPEHHCLVCGVSGRGKTRRTVYPTVIMSASAGHSMIIADAKGEIYRNTAKTVMECGLDVKVINLREPLRSNRYSPLQLAADYWYQGNRNRAILVLKETGRLITRCVASSVDKYWQTAAVDVFVGFGLLILENFKKEDLTFSNMQRLVNEYMSYGENRPALNHVFNTKAASYSMLSTITGLTAENTASCISSTFNTAISDFCTRDDLKELLSSSDFSLTDIGKKPTAVYLICPDESTSLYSIASLFVEQSYSELVRMADISKSNKLAVKVDYILDEFGNFTGNDWPNKLTAARSRGIRFFLILQSLSQLILRYNEAGTRTIMDNCRTLIFLGGRDLPLLNEMSNFSGMSIYNLQNLKTGEALVIQENMKPYTAKLPEWNEWKKWLTGSISRTSKGNGHIHASGSNSAHSFISELPEEKMKTSEGSKGNKPEKKEISFSGLLSILSLNTEKNSGNSLI